MLQGLNAASKQFHGWLPRELDRSDLALSISLLDLLKWLQYTYTEKTSIPFPFKLNGIWSWWQFSFWFSEPNWTPFGSKSKGKLSPRSYPIQFERKWNASFLSITRFSIAVLPTIHYDQTTWRTLRVLLIVYTVVYSEERVFYWGHILCPTPHST